MKKKLSMLAFFCILSVTSVAIAELKTTVNPIDYVLQEVVDVNDNYITFESGMIVEILPPWDIEIGDHVYLQIFNLENAKNQSVKPYEVVFLPEAFKINRIEAYFWAGEIQRVVILEDGSRWLLSEKSFCVKSWRPGDYVTIKTTGSKCNGQYFSFYMVMGRESAKIVDYTIWEGYYLWEVHD